MTMSASPAPEHTPGEPKLACPMSVLLPQRYGQQAALLGQLPRLRRLLDRLVQRLHLQP